MDEIPNREKDRLALFEKSVSKVTTDERQTATVTVLRIKYFLLLSGSRQYLNSELVMLSHNYV